MGSCEQTINAVLHRGIGTKVSAHDRVLGGLGIGAKVGDSKTAEVHWEVQEAFGEAKI